VPLSHLEVLSEVLVSAPPVKMDHTDSLVSSHLMEVRISHVVLLTVCRKTSISMWGIIVLISFSNMPSPLRHHVFFLLLSQHVEHHWLIKMEKKQGVDNSESMLIMKLCHFPKGITEGIFEESSDVLESPPSLCSVSRFLSVLNPLTDITISFFSKRSEWILNKKYELVVLPTCQSFRISRTYLGYHTWNPQYLWVFL